MYTRLQAWALITLLEVKAHVGAASEKAGAVAGRGCLLEELAAF